MAHNKKIRKLNRQRSHYHALMRNMALALVEQEVIETTEAKAKELRGFVDRLITLGKGGTIHNRRHAVAVWGNKKVKAKGKKEDRFDPITKLFGELATRYKSRPGGYTRIIKLGFRPGDSAPLVRLELVDAKPNAKKSEADAEEKKVTKKPATKTDD